MATKLEIANNKLERLYQERNAASASASAEFKAIPFGQPNIIGRKDIYAKVKQYDAKARKLTKEIEKQEAYIAKLERVEQAKEDNPLIKDLHVVGSSEFETVGAKTSVNNLEYFKDKLNRMIEDNESAKEYNKNREKGTPKAKTHGVEITKLTRKIAYLETLKAMADKAENCISDHAQSLIDDGKVNQWAKKPIYYFVKGLRKVALELNNDGEFVVSKRYPTTNDADAKYVEELIRG